MQGKEKAMKCTMDRIFGIYDAGSDRTLGLRPLMCGFQDVVALHSDRAGHGIDWLLGQKKAWVMHRMHIKIRQMPVMGEALKFFTWHKGKKGFKAFRDYEVWCGMRKRICAASSWLFMDLAKARIVKVPEETGQWFPTEAKNAIEADIDTFCPVPKAPWEPGDTIAVRSSDVDPIGHVNNSVYLDYLETAVARRFGGMLKIREVWIQFHKEISAGVASVRVGIGEDGECRSFTISSGAGIHAFGKVTVAAAAGAGLNPGAAAQDEGLRPVR